MSGQFFFTSIIFDVWRTAYTSNTQIVFDIFYWSFGILQITERKESGVHNKGQLWNVKFYTGLIRQNDCDINSLPTSAIVRGLSYSSPPTSVKPQGLPPRSTISNTNSLRSSFIFRTSDTLPSSDQNLSSILLCWQSVLSSSLVFHVCSKIYFTQ